MNLWESMIVGVITGAFSAGTIYGILHTRMGYIEQSVRSAHERLTHHEDRFHPPKGS